MDALGRWAWTLAASVGVLAACVTVPDPPQHKTEGNVKLKQELTFEIDLDLVKIGASSSMEADYDVTNESGSDVCVEFEDEDGEPLDKPIEIANGETVPITVPAGAAVAKVTYRHTGGDREGMAAIPPLGAVEFPSWARGSENKHVVQLRPVGPVGAVDLGESPTLVWGSSLVTGQDSAAAAAELGTTAIRTPGEPSPQGVDVFMSHTISPLGDRSPAMLFTAATHTLTSGLDDVEVFLDGAPVTLTPNAVAGWALWEAVIPATYGRHELVAHWTGENDSDVTETLVMTFEP